MICFWNSRYIKICNFYDNLHLLVKLYIFLIINYQLSILEVCAISIAIFSNIGMFALTKYEYSERTIRN